MKIKFTGQSPITEDLGANQSKVFKTHNAYSWLGHHFATLLAFQLISS